MGCISDAAHTAISFKCLRGLRAGFVCFGLVLLCLKSIFSPASHSHRVPMYVLPFAIPPHPQTYCLIFRQATAVLKSFQDFPACTYTHTHTDPLLRALVCMGQLQCRAAALIPCAPGLLAARVPWGVALLCPHPLMHPPDFVLQHRGVTYGCNGGRAPHQTKLGLLMLDGQAEAMPC